MLALEEVGMGLVGDNLLHTAATVGRRRGTVGLVHLQGNGEEAVVAVVGQLYVGDNGRRRCRSLLFLGRLGGLSLARLLFLVLRLNVGSTANNQCYSH